MSTVWQDNAARFATTREDVDALLAARRREGIAQAAELLYGGRPGGRQRALWALTRSFLEQLEIEGIPSAGVPGMPGYEAPAPGRVRTRTGGKHAADVLSVVSA